MRAEWQRLRSNDCVDSFTADAVVNFFLRTCCVKHKQHDKRKPGLFKEEFRCTEMLCLCSKIYCCYEVTSNKLKFSSKDLNKRVLEQSGDGPLEKYRRVLNEKINVTSNNRGFRTNNHSVATYEQNTKGLSYFYPKRFRSKKNEVCGSRCFRKPISKPTVTDTSHKLNSKKERSSISAHCNQPLHILRLHRCFWSNR